MSLLIFCLVVLILVVLGIVLVKEIPSIPAPLNWLLPVLIVVAGLVAIVLKTGVL